MTHTPQLASSRSRCWKGLSAPPGCRLQQRLLQGSSRRTRGTSGSRDRSCLFKPPSLWVTLGQRLIGSGGTHLLLVVRAPRHVPWELSCSLGAVGAPTLGWHQGGRLCPGIWASWPCLRQSHHAGLPSLWLGFWCAGRSQQVCSFRAPCHSRQVPYKRHPQAQILSFFSLHMVSEQHDRWLWFPSFWSVQSLRKDANIQVSDLGS